MNNNVGALPYEKLMITRLYLCLNFVYSMAGRKLRLNTVKNAERKQRAAKPDYSLVVSIPF